ncbi:helix-turn-helix transcriptional regulator [Thalassoroseus pseudoceratinae]|uniref:helix-turn-helix transcriptional regulator n=1 Tax=Thalassoroseus pseudoceratinae TaxID=2713176 RepID=UPI0014223AB1|nr:transcriptional regulator [Thalassoroseus pseudoceratinae]
MQYRLESQDQEFLQRLNQIGGGTIQELCVEFGVTATAVRQRLTRLEGQQLVERVVVREGRGRPAHRYCVTEIGQRELGDNYADLAQILWRELMEIEDIEVRGRVLARITDALVERFRSVSSGKTLGEKFERLKDALSDRGFQVELDHTGDLPILRENHCPYLDLAQADDSICELEKEVFRRVLGTDVRLTQCCLDGHSCCEFEPA